MSRNLLIMRHAKSDWGASRDFDRCLAKRGQHDAPRMGAWMEAQGLKPDHVVSSPALRAMETVTLACEAMGISGEEIDFDQRIYEAGLNDLLNVLGNQPQDANRVLLVGHNPGMEELVHYLWGDAVQLPPDENLMPTATLAHLSLPDDWTALEYGCGQFQSIIRPRSLSDLALKCEPPRASSKKTCTFS
ncbi:hypothetical protein MNBD_GAMMA26-1479 [hydrothermal vent metagenome]|uniref:Phosphohistidine phosphatase SixA n=1 Tax=hydrothermal vent metagenome TaxID=652676 RepID=A0A3B1B6T9_9ZZZZ